MWLRFSIVSIQIYFNPTGWWLGQEFSTIALIEVWSNTMRVSPLISREFYRDCAYVTTRGFTCKDMPSALLHTVFGSGQLIFLFMANIYIIGQHNFSMRQETHFP